MIMNMIYITSDNEEHASYEQAVLHTNDMINAVGNQEYVDTTIVESSIK